MKRKISAHQWMACMAIFTFSALLIMGGLTLGNGAQVPAGGSRSSGQSSADAAKSPGTVSITGLVRQPLRLGLRDIRAFGSVTVRRVDHRAEGFFGDFEFRGVPLTTLISMAGPRKESSSFMRPTDLAIVVQNESGKRVLFSYGELLFRAPSDVVLAFDAEPMIPKRSCDSCHKDRSDHNWRSVFNQKQIFPRLIAGRDLDADRSLEGVTSIEVLELFSTAPQPKSKSQPTASEPIEIREGATGIATFRNLSSYPRHEVHALEVGDAMGYHGEVRCEGALLTDVLTASKAPSGPDVGYVIAAADGFRAMISSAELFSTVQSPPVLIVDHCNGQPLKEQGNFKLIVANDAIAERWVKSVATINVVRATPRDTH
jgi:hypothetical protein